MNAKNIKYALKDIRINRRQLGSLAALTAVSYGLKPLTTVLAQEDQDTGGTNPAEIYGITVKKGCAEETQFKVPTKVTPTVLYSFSTGEQVAKQNVSVCLPANTIGIYDGYGLNGALDGQDVAFVNDSSDDYQLEFTELWSGQIQVVHSEFGETAFWQVINKLLDHNQVHGTIRPLCGWDAPQWITDNTDLAECVGPVQVFEGGGSAAPVDSSGNTTYTVEDKSATCPAIGTIDCNPREASGNGKTIDFTANRAVEGNTIVLDDGTEFTNCHGYFTQGGEVTQGVVSYWPAESVYPECQAAA